MIELGAEVNAMDDVSASSCNNILTDNYQGGYTALHWACFYKNKEVAQLLIKDGADTAIQNSDVNRNTLN